MQTNNLAHILKKWENAKYNNDAGLTKLWKSLKGIDIEWQKYIKIKSYFLYFKCETFQDEKEELYLDINGTTCRYVTEFKYYLDFN